MDDVELVGLYWTVSGPGRGARRARVEPVRLPRPLRAGPARRVLRDRHLARRPRARARDAHARRDAARSSTTTACAHLELECLLRLVRRPGRRAPHGLRRDAATCCSRRPPRWAPTTSRSATSPGRRASCDAAHRALRASSAPTRRSGTTALIAYEFMPFDVNVHTHRRGARGRRRRRRAQRRDRGRHLALREARDPARRSCAGSRRTCSAGSSCRDGQFENMPDPVDEVVNHRRLPGEGEFAIPGYVERRAGGRLPGPVGRRGALGGAAQPADRARSSTGHTRRRRRNSAPGAAHRKERDR